MMVMKERGKGAIGLNPANPNVSGWINLSLTIITVIVIIKP